jgi:hypothetical protein
MAFLIAHRSVFVPTQDARSFDDPFLGLLCTLSFVVLRTDSCFLFFLSFLLLSSLLFLILFLSLFLLLLAI